MAKYTIEDSTLTSIADAIRTQYQDDSPINPLDMAEAILGIEGGGGLDLPFDIDYGEFEVMEDVIIVNKNTSYNTYSFNHALGKIPREFIMWIDDESNIRGAIGTIPRASFSFQKYAYSGATKDDFRYAGTLSRINSSSQTNGTSVSTSYLFNSLPNDETEGYVVCTEDTVYLGKMLGTSTSAQFILKPNCTYKWIAIADK